MDAGSSSTVRGRSRIGYRSLHPFLPINGNPRPYRHNAERYIPNRSAMDFGFARYQLTQSAPDKEGENAATESTSPSSKDAYRKCLAKALGVDRTRILAFRNKPPLKTPPYAEQYSPPPPMKHRKRQRSIPLKPERTLDLPGFLDDFYLNLLDWGSKGVLSIALEDTVYLWSNANGGSTSELVTVDQESGPVTSVCWAPDGERIAVGLTSSDIQLWDSQSNRLLRTLRRAHESRVLSLCWNGSILTSGGEDGKIVNRDVRTRSQVIQRYQGHQGEVCGLKWSSSGEQLASGGNDRLIYIWNLSMSSSRPQNQNQWLHRFEDHTSAVKALAWCPFQRNLLASGGGDNDRCIKFWNTTEDETLRLWRVFDVRGTPKPAAKMRYSEHFGNFSTYFIRIDYGLYTLKFMEYWDGSHMRVDISPAYIKRFRRTLIAEFILSEWNQCEDIKKEIKLISNAKATR
ncbi:uncharacterized protein A4U43_C02F13290 [Asparagus officinalis]|uniref:CDC20/Fizzy WD40 domain-containing protein n=1 Tax=Asparagus officinalis TaxID=4686 RepID=A0A5P1FJW4_ASPOF|nr:uncharacterized protein A4U43_C02F13290 [Asparagus officinalis]